MDEEQLLSRVSRNEHPIDQSLSNAQQENIGGTENRLNVLFIELESQRKDIQKQEKQVESAKELMQAVVVILVVMVGAMILSLQIALLQSKQPETINVVMPNTNPAGAGE